MDHHARGTFAGLRARRLVKAGVEVAARRRGGEPERMLLVRLLNRGPVVRQRRHLLPGALAGNTVGRIGPVRLEMKLLVGVSKAVEIMRGTEIRLNIAPEVGLQCRDI